ncbi:MAG: hypothetical protein AAGU75_23020, partial [Bacillota bacterium]
MQNGKIAERKVRIIVIVAIAGLIISAAVFWGLLGKQPHKSQTGNEDNRNDGDINIFEASNYDYILMYGSPQLWDDEKNLSVDVNGDGVSEEFIISKDFNDGVILKGIRREGQEGIDKSMNFWTLNLSGLLPESLKRGDSIDDNYFVQISCCDIDEDGTKEVLVSAGDKQIANVTAIYEYSESGAIPFKYCGY